MLLQHLEKMDSYVEKAGSDDPSDIADYLGYLFVDPGPSIEGFITVRKQTICYGVNKGMRKKKYKFGVGHELYHGVCGHIQIPGFLSGKALSHVDGIGSMADYKLVASTEREANIGSADLICDTDTTLEMIGYDNGYYLEFRQNMADFTQYDRDLRKYLDLSRCNPESDKYRRKVNWYRSELERLYEEIQEQSSDLVNSGICFSKGEIARELGVPESIVSYKIDALSIRGYDIDMVELPSFEKIFRH